MSYVGLIRQDNCFWTEIRGIRGITSNTIQNIYIYMTKIPHKSCKELACTILCGLPNLDQVTGFNNLICKIIEAKIEENCKKSDFLHFCRQLFAELND